MIESHRNRALPRCTTVRVHRVWVTTLALLLSALPAAAQDEPTEAATSTEAGAAPDAATEAAGAESVGSGAEGEGPAEEPGATEASAEGEGEADVAAEASSEDVLVGGGDLFESAVSGDVDTAADEGGEGGAAASAFDLNGYVRSDTFVGKLPGYDRAELQAAYGELSLKMNMKGGEVADAFAELRFRYGQQGQVRQLFTDLREAYVSAFLGDLELRLGQQIVVWGRADAFNPTNNLTPVDLRVRSPVEDDRRVGNVGARAFYDLRPLRIEAAWMPLYKPVEIPDNVALPTGVYFGPPDYPSTKDPDLADGTVAGRLHFLFDSFEGSVSYLHGYALMPGVALGGYVTSSANGPPPEVYIRRTAYNHDVYGADFSTAIGEYGLRAELAYRNPLHYERRVYAPSPDVQYVVGVDRTLGNLSLIFQYAGRYVIDWQEEEAGTATVDALRYNSDDMVIRERIGDELRFRNQILFQQLAEVQHLISLRAEYLALHETLSLSAFGLMNVTTKEWLAYPKVSYKFSDALSGAVGGEIYFGPEDTLFDLVEDELSAGYAELRYTF